MPYRRTGTLTRRPYPSVADLGLAAALLPLLSRQQGAALQLGLLLPAGLLLLGVLGPAMCAMWLQHESANSNFLYSITLLYGAWQVGAEAAGAGLGCVLGRQGDPCRACGCVVCGISATVSGAISNPIDFEPTPLLTLMTLPGAHLSAHPPLPPCRCCCWVRCWV